MQRLMLIFWESTGGEEGLNGLTPLIRLASASTTSCSPRWSRSRRYLIALARSHWGLLLRAIRGDEATCQAAGINVTFYKIASLVISAAFAGARRRDVCALPAPGEPAAVLGRHLDHDHHHGLCRRHRLASTGPPCGAILLMLLTEMLRSFGEWRLLIYTLSADR